MKKREIVINVCYGGFGLSHEAIMLYAELKGIKLHAEPQLYAQTENGEIFWHYYKTADLKEFWHTSDIPRDDPALVKVVKKLGDKAEDFGSVLKIVKIPADVDWEIEEKSGKECVAEKHRTWS